MNGVSIIGIPFRSKSSFRLPRLLGEDPSSEEEEGLGGLAAEGGFVLVGQDVTTIASGGNEGTARDATTATATAGVGTGGRDEREEGWRRRRRRRGNRGRRGGHLEEGPGPAGTRGLDPTDTTGTSSSSHGRGQAETLLLPALLLGLDAEGGKNLDAGGRREGGRGGIVDRRAVQVRVRRVPRRGGTAGGRVPADTAAEGQDVDGAQALVELPTRRTLPSPSTSSSVFSSSVSMSSWEDGRDGNEGRLRLAAFLLLLAIVTALVGNYESAFQLFQVGFDSFD